MFRQSSPPQNRETILDSRIREAIDHLDDKPGHPILWDRNQGQSSILRVRDLVLATERPLYHFEKFESLRPYIEAAKLPRKREIEDALDAGWSSSNHQRFASGDDMVLKTFRAEGHLDPTQSDTFTCIINTLGKENNWPLNDNGDRQRTQEAMQRAKDKILSGGETSQGRRVWPQWDGAYGGIKWREASLLDSMSLEQLAALVEEVANLRRQMSAPSEAQQERLRNFADTSRGHAVPRPGDLDSLSGEVRYVDVKGKPKPVVVGGSETTPTTGPMDRSVPIGLSPEMTALFTDPQTGKLFSGLAIRRLIRTNPNHFRLMLRTNEAFMNRLLQEN